MRTQNVKKKEVVYLNEFKVSPIDYSLDPAFKELKEKIERMYGPDYSDENLHRFQKVNYEYAKTCSSSKRMNESEVNVFNEAVFYFGFFLIKNLGGGFVRVGNMLSLNVKSEDGDNYYLNFVKVVARFWDSEKPNYLSDYFSNLKLVMEDKQTFDSFKRKYGEGF